ncbi:putative PpiC-type peptidyl-prolyl cis-trans isomerase [Paenibacillus mucilaginosus 3016]|uniref:peptidylprolyl isomerase n=2 Tax=Paenibacillus mucilaginosus TaxID=61624 RepID=H6NSE4_9BACL|nr:peptidyl-prolyl cis-trans isomerase [Paenibacillus mucilaginosus]AFC33694.1 putative PpiC-type peptidyl-prolyl cis-trans isomerase [Paenibacillus mucilaginosus 3016]AFH66027.1 peptidyl-prolyl cis-trans isomerase [Paenibacillus mucilaginosus K02]WFA22097.1 peptidylprolyl isomerase [Paenibacillus mucilaginosus]
MRNLKVLWATIAVLLIAVVILSSVLTAHYVGLLHSNPNPKQPKQADPTRTVATIGEHVITQQDLEDQLLHKHGRELLDHMIDQYVIRREAEVQGVLVSDSEVQQEILRMQQGYDSESAFWESMKEQLGLTREELIADTENRLLAEKMTIRGIQVSDAEVDAYMQAHEEEFRPRLMLKLQQIVSASREQAQKAAAELAKGADFGQVARDRSLDDATRGSGGELGWIEEGDPFVPAAVMKAAKPLRKGEVSKPVEWEGQYVLVKVQDRKELSKGSPQEIREQVRKEIALSQAPPIKQTVSRLRDKWKVQVQEGF